MTVKKGDFVELEFVGKIKETGEIFDTTDPKIAKDAGILKKNTVYRPLVVVVGKGQLIPGVDEALIGMKENEEKSIEVPPEKGFGKRDPKLVKLIPITELRKRGIKPKVGMRVTIDNAVGRIVNITGGRVRIDFNHPLAGKHLKLDLKVKKIIKDDKEKIKGIISMYYPNAKLEDINVEIKDGTVSIEVDDTFKFDNRPHSNITLTQARIAKEIWDNIEGVKRVEFISAFEKTKAKSTT